MSVTERIEQLIAPAVEGMGFSIVRVQLSGGDRLRLQVMAERQDGQAMVVDDCADLSRAISAILDVEDPIVEAYTLEVSSPGIDRPLVRLRDFERYAGHEARIETNVSVSGHRRFRGRVLGVEGDVVRVSVEGEDIAVPFSAISKAKLVLTEELLGMSEGRQGR
ncbi:ribosome maturation factor RimP [Shumkonia mesophila]|uniref:ribosome maturation factor RimP n=1 Tax=Shumkonia mesophila TaxID=2838854 RepID=UPI002934DBEC|nr:ribosome maturation factor RimP [Shumkonia mesophila]